MDFRNIWVKPSVSLEIFHSDHVLPGKSVSVVKVYGLICDSICVRRSEIAMGNIPGVIAVNYTGDNGRFIVEHVGSMPDENLFQDAVLSRVFLMRLRIILHSIRLNWINLKGLLSTIGR
jgi:hypothetical protein